VNGGTTCFLKEGLRVVTSSGKAKSVSTEKGGKGILRSGRTASGYFYSRSISDQDKPKKSGDGRILKITKHKRMGP